MKRPTHTELLVMQILRDGAHGLYGLEIVEQSAGAVRRGSVYVLLGRLEEKGFVRVTRPTGPQPHPGLARPRYRLTALGVRCLESVQLGRLRPATIALSGV